MPPSSKIDPTRSVSLRRSFAGGITRQFQSLAKAIVGLVFTEDAFGLAPDPPPFSVPTLNKRWKYWTQEEAVDEFEKWLRNQVSKTLTSQTEATRWRRYVNRGFVKGANRAFDDVDRATKKRGLDSLRAQGFQEGRREQFLRQSFGKVTAIEKVRALQSRALADVKGMTEDLITKARRSLTDSLVKNLSPREASAALRKVLKVSETRADSIAFTELVRAHADGQLEAMEQLGVERVGVAVEWSTASGACPLCSTLEGIVLTVQEAKGLIPRHVRCRCAFTLANVGEDATERKGQVRSKTKIDRALKKSANLGSDTWKPPIPVSRERPISTLNVECTCHPSLVLFESLIKKDGGE